MGVGEGRKKGIWVYSGKRLPGGFYLYYFPSSQICYSPFFKMRKARLEELHLLPSWEEPVQKSLLQDTLKPACGKCKGIKTGLGGGGGQGAEDLGPEKQLHCL